MDNNSTTFINPGVKQLINYKQEIAEIVKLSEEAIEIQDKQIRDLQDQLNRAMRAQETVTKTYFSEYHSLHARFKKLTYVACAALASTIGLILWMVVK